MTASHDFSQEAEALFKRWAERHNLHYDIRDEENVEVLWEFPQQTKLWLPVTLGLQDLNVLNFGVADFWSFIHPFETNATYFENLLDAWLSGNARVAVLRWGGRTLQMRDGSTWKTVYWANVWPLPILRKPKSFIVNQQS